MLIRGSSEKHISVETLKFTEILFLTTFIGKLTLQLSEVLFKDCDLDLKIVGVCGSIPESIFGLISIIKTIQLMVDLNTCHLT
ncbi:MAG: hypothetical protein AB2693_11480, partial [Candidatus Thiodiazotropha sp.]